MEIIRDDQAKQIQIWMTRQESQDDALQDRLKPAYAQWKREKYLVAVFRSGRGDLRESVTDLLLHNQKVLAQRAMERQRMANPSSGKK